MIRANGHHADTKDESKEQSSSDLDALKSSLAELRDDVTKLLHNTVGTGKSGAGMLKDRAVDLKDWGVESVERFGQKIGERPLLSAAIALGIGFVLAKLLTGKR